MRCVTWILCAGSVFAADVAGVAPAGEPVVWLGRLTGEGALRVTAGGALLPAKMERNGPEARVSWVSTGAASYRVELGAAPGSPEPAMIGTGDRVTYGRTGVRGDLGVGLWAHPAPLDFDGDGDTDLIVGCPDHPYNGTYLFLNRGSNAAPLYDRGEWLGAGKKDVVAADFNGDGRVDLVASGGYFSDVRANRLSKWVPVKVERDYFISRDDLWNPVDWDGDGRIDLLAGVSDWRDYGWDDAFDAAGRWQRGPLHGYVYLHRNVGTNTEPRYDAPVRLSAGGRDVDLYGSPTPMAVDWFGKGRLDLIGGSFVDTLTVFRNGGRGLDAGAPVRLAGGREYRAELCMIQPRLARWHADGRPSIMVGEEDGRVALLENLAPAGEEPRLAEPRFLQSVDPWLKAGVLSRPVAVDWNGDGKLDLLSGTSAGYIRYFENRGTSARPEFHDGGNLKAGGVIIRRMAGENGSIQGPAEAKWGYSNPAVADWDGDGRLDLLVNDIWGDVVWYRGSAEGLEAARMVEVAWPGAPPKPDWVWWNPKAGQLLTQWRTTPRAVDWNGDGLMDLVMLDWRGYLALYRRERRDGKLVLLPPERIFREANGRFLYLAAGRAGRSGRRKIDVADWDGDGDLDLITDTTNGAGWYENLGPREAPVMQWRGEITTRSAAGHSPTAFAADWNGDGKLDLIVGGEDGHFYFYDRRFLDRHKPQGRNLAR